MHQDGTPKDAEKQAGPPCLACGGPTRISPGKGPHFARIDCLDPSCRAWRWAPKPRPKREVES